MLHIECILPVYESKPLVSDSFAEKANKRITGLKDCIFIKKETKMNSKQLIANYRGYNTVGEEEKHENKRISTSSYLDDEKQKNQQQPQDEQQQQYSIRDGGWRCFGCHCLRDTWYAADGSGEPIVLVFAGCGAGRSCCILNVDKCQFTKIKKVCIYVCTHSVFFVVVSEWINMLMMFNFITFFCYNYNIYIICNCN